MTAYPSPHSTAPPPAPPAPPLPRKSPRSSRALLITLGVVIALIAAVVVVWSQLRQSPEDVAVDYLESIRSGDVDTALSHVEQRPTGTQALFLTRAAISDDWAVKSTRLVSQKDGALGITKATVNATIESQGESQSMELNIRRFSRSDWGITNPFAKVAFGKSPFGYAGANGVTAPLGTHYFFPGAYDFYSESGPFSVSQNNFLLTVDETRDPADKAPQAEFEWDINDDVTAATQDALNAEIDACVERFKVVRTTDCPFGGNFDALTDGKGRHLQNLGDMQWNVIEYPEVTVEPRPAANSEVFKDSDGDPERVVALMVTHSEGIVELSGTGYEDGEPVEFTRQCPIADDVRGVYATEQGVSLTPITDVPC